MMDEGMRGDVNEERAYDSLPLSPLRAHPALQRALIHGPLGGSALHYPLERPNPHRTYIQTQSQPAS
jgi:hypothetical protein